MERSVFTRGAWASAAVLACVAVAGCAGPTGAQSSGSGMSFFVASSGAGKGADLGGLAGADKHCQTLAQAAGAGGKTWRAYLSASGVNARDRIGKGPWRNAKGEVVAKDVEQLHSADNNLTSRPR